MKKLLKAFLPMITATATLASAEPLNVVFIMADDLGWSDTTLYDTTALYETPNIERLAARGMTFNRAYTASPLCSPTRASILTGQTPARNGSTAPQHHLATVQLQAGVQASAPADQKALPTTSVSRLDTTFPTLGKQLRATGVRTGHFGKWHLGRVPYTPLEHGFEVDIPQWFGPGPAGGFVAPWSYPDFSPNVAGEHIEDRMAEEAVLWMRSVANEPFFLQYWQFSVHAPFDAKQTLIDYYRPKIDLDSPQRSPTYAGMVHSLDDAVGSILDAIDNLGIADRTAIIFYSDNGGNMYNTIDETDAAGQPFSAIPTSNSPLRGGKATIWEGGVRVPMIVVWPGMTEPGSRSDVLTQSTDFYPTILRMLHVRLPENHPIDGVDLTPALVGEPFDRGPVFNFFPHSPPIVPDQLPPSISVHEGDWKLIRLFHQGNSPEEHEYLLFNLEDDIGERNNLAAANPAKLLELDALIEGHILDANAVVPQPNPAFWARSVWTGAIGANWNEPGNWLQQPAPESLLVFTGSDNTATVNDFPPATVFGDILFTPPAGAFTLSGNPITSAQISVSSDPDSPVTHTIALDMHQTAGRTVTTTANGALTLAGRLSGVGNFDKRGEGLLTLTGTNTFDGVLQVFTGTLQVNALANIGQASPFGSGNRFRIGHGDTPATLVFARLNGPQSTDRFTFIGSNAANHYGSATFRNNSADPEQTVTFTAAAFNSVQANVNRDRFLALGGTNTGPNTIRGVIADNSATGPIRVRKEDGGTWELAGDNTFTGGLTVTEGTLALSGPQNFSGGIALEEGGTLQAKEAASLAAQSNHLTFSGGTLRVTDSPTGSFNVGTARNFILAGDARLDIAPGRNLQLPGTTGTGGILTGAGDVTVNGPGQFTPSNVNNDFIGSWNIIGGATVSLSTTLAEGSNGRLGHPANPVHLDDGTFHFSASGTGPGNTHHRALTLGPAGGTFITGIEGTQSPVITWTGGISGPGGLTQNSSSTSAPHGTLVLAGPNTHTGDTLVQVGTLKLADTGTLVFQIGAPGVNNRIAGTGTVVLDGQFDFNLSEASPTTGDGWSLVATETLTATFGASFRVTGFAPEGDGLWTRTIDQAAYEFSQATGRLTVTAGVAMLSYPSWIAGFALSEAESDPLASPAGDGLSNSLKYALNLHPTHPNAGALPLTQVTAGGNLRLTAVVRAHDPALSIAAEASADLVAWNVPVNESVEVDQTGVPQGFARREWQTAIAMNGGERKFLRLKVELL